MVLDRNIEMLSNYEYTNNLYYSQAYSSKFEIDLIFNNYYYAEKKAYILMNHWK